MVETETSIFLSGGWYITALHLFDVLALHVGTVGSLDNHSQIPLTLPINLILIEVHFLDSHIAIYIWK